MSFAPAPGLLVPTRGVEFSLSPVTEKPCNLATSQLQPTLSNVTLWLGYVGRPVIAYKPILRRAGSSYWWATTIVQMPIGAMIVTGVTNLPSGWSRRPDRIVTEDPPGPTGFQVLPLRLNEAPTEQAIAANVWGGSCFPSRPLRHDIIAQHLEFLGISGR